MANIKLARIAISFALVALVLIHASGIRRVNFLSYLDELSYVLRIIVENTPNTNAKVVNVVIDDKSLNEAGLWPWNQTVRNELFEALEEYYRPLIVGINAVNWPQDSTHRSRSKITESTTTTFAIGYYFSSRIIHGIPIFSLPIKPAPFSDESIVIPNLPVAHVAYAGMPIEKRLMKTAGFTNVATRDPESLVQKIPLFMEYEKKIYDSFPLAILRLLQQNHSYKFEYSSSDPILKLTPAPTRIKIGDFLDVPIDQNGNVLFPSPRYNNRVLTISATDIINRRIDPRLLADRIVLVGISTPNIVNIPEQTRFQNISPTAFHANLLAYILDRQLKHLPSEARIINLLLLVTIAVCIIWANLRLKPLGIGFVFVTCILGVISIQYYFWNQLDLALPLASQIFLILSVTLVFIFANVYSRWSKQKQTAESFRHAVSPQVIQELSQKNRGIPILGEARQVSVLSCHIRGYPAIKEKLSPYQLTRLTNLYLTRMNESIFRHRGTVDHFRFDQIVGFWGAPLVDHQHANHSIETALDMQSQLPILNRAFMEWGWKPIRIGIGLHSGTFNVANFGPIHLNQYNIFGNEFEIVVWLEQLTKHYGVNIIVSEPTRIAATDFLYIELDKVRYARDSAPITLYEPIARANNADQTLVDEIQAYGEALKSFRERQWNVAKRQFSHIIVNYSGRLLYQIYLSRCLQFEKKPPRDEWDGIVFHPLKPSSI